MQEGDGNMVTPHKDVVLHKNGILYTDWGINRFPDGQIQFWISKDHSKLDLDIAIKTSEHLDLLLQMEVVMRFQSVQVNYMYGARSDKLGTETTLVCPVAELTATVLETCLTKNLQIVMPHCNIPGLTDCPEKVIIPINHYLESRISQKMYGAILFPDESAEERYRGYIMSAGTPTYTCTKERDQTTGEITRYVVPTIPTKGPILVIDDLCDGGATFLKIADQLPENPLELSIVHGVFSGEAIPRLSEKYKNIWVTNSFRDFAGTGFHVKNVWRAGGF